MAQKPVIVVDGSTVAYEEMTKEGKPKLANIVTMRHELEQRGFDPIVIVDAALHHEIDDPKQLESLLDSQAVRQAPADTDADYFVLTTASEHQSQVVTNDLYRDYQDEFGWIADRRVPYMIVEGKVELYEPDLEQQER